MDMTISFLSLPALCLPGPTSGPSGLIVAPSDEGLDVGEHGPDGFAPPPSGRGVEDAAQPVDESGRGQRGRFASMLKFNMTV